MLRALGHVDEASNGCSQEGQRSALLRAPRAGDVVMWTDGHQAERNVSYSVSWLTKKVESVCCKGKLINQQFFGRTSSIVLELSRSRERVTRQNRKHLVHILWSQNTTSIKTGRKKIFLTHMQDKAGNNGQDIQDIADAFA